MHQIDYNELRSRIDTYTPSQETLTLLSSMNKVLEYKEVSLEDNFANVFIIGLMRSGTTLTSQLLAKYTSLGYISNVVSKFWENPQYGVALGKSLGLFNRDAIELVSVAGNTDGGENVHEFGYFWADLLNLKTNNPSLACRDIEKVNWNLLRNKVLSINYTFNESCVYKNTLVGHFASKFSTVFKKPVFIYIKRNRLDVATSVLDVRKKRYGVIDEWWSMKPPEFEKLKGLDPYEQVIAQMFYLEEDIKRQVSNIPKEQLLEIKYEDLCQSPEALFDPLREKFENYGLEFESKPVNDGPVYTSRKSSSCYDRERLECYLKKYFKEY